MVVVAVVVVVVEIVVVAVVVVVEVVVVSSSSRSSSSSSSSGNNCLLAWSLHERNFEKSRARTCTEPKFTDLTGSSCSSHLLVRKIIFTGKT